jgi:hypothetical protein
MTINDTQSATFEKLTQAFNTSQARELVLQATNYTLLQRLYACKSHKAKYKTEVERCHRLFKIDYPTQSLAERTAKFHEHIGYEQSLHAQYSALLAQLESVADDGSLVKSIETILGPEEDTPRLMQGAVDTAKMRRQAVAIASFLEQPAAAAAGAAAAAADAAEVAVVEEAVEEEEEETKYSQKEI